MTFAERVEKELRDPDAALLEALREVDRLTPAVPALAPPEPAAPTLVGGNSVWRAPPAVQSPSAAEQLAALATPLGSYAASGQSVAPLPASFDLRPWYWPYVAVPLFGHNGMDYILRDEFGGARVSIAWLHAHRYNIVQAIRRLNGRDGE